MAHPYGWWLCGLWLLMTPLLGQAQVTPVPPDSTRQLPPPLPDSLSPPAPPAVDTAFPGLDDLPTFVSRSRLEPRRAAMLAVAFPGGGQLYNRKYWKLPILYGAAASLVYALDFNTTQFVAYRDAFIFRNDGDPTTTDAFPRLNDRQLQRQRDFYRRNRDLTVILCAAAYAISIIDALVDAHLAEFNVNDDLALRVRPHWQPDAVAPGQYQTGLTATFTFR